MTFVDKQRVRSLLEITLEVNNYHLLPNEQAKLFLDVTQRKTKRRNRFLYRPIDDLRSSHITLLFALCLP